MANDDAPFGGLLGRVSGVCRDLHGRHRLDGFAACDGEDACFVSARYAPGPFGAVEARALGGAHRLIAELGVTDVCRLDGKEKLDRDAIGSASACVKNDTTSSWSAG